MLSVAVMYRRKPTSFSSVGQAGHLGSVLLCRKLISADFSSPCRRIPCAKLVDINVYVGSSRELQPAAAAASARLSFAATPAEDV